MKTSALLLLISAVADAVSFIDFVKEDWDSFKMQFNKTYYNDIEENFRMKIFMDNKYRINRHNRRHQRGEVSYTLRMNHFGDMLPHEIRRKMTGYRKYPSRINAERIEYLPPYNVSLPPSIDWRKLGAVTPVKDQGSCGSCWAFSATGALEGQRFRKTKKLVSLSEQNLVDCTKAYGNDGCNGGMQELAFLYIEYNKGIDTEESYPYEAEDGKCRFKPAQSGAKDYGYFVIPQGDESQLQSAVATVGPIAVSIDVVDDFMYYDSGVFFSETCDKISLNHAVLVVGYGTTKKGEEYWLVKNSWSTKWGEQGYIRMSRNKDNNCGIASDPLFPLV